MTVGHVTSFSMRRGFGSIQVEGQEDPVFLHYSDVAEGVDGLEPGQRVEFELEDDGSGPRARLVVALGA